MEFRADIFNVWNHAQFYTVDGTSPTRAARLGKCSTFMILGCSSSR